MKTIFNALLFWINLSTKYDTIKKDPEKKKKSIYFAVRTILTSLFSAIVVVLSIWGIIACFNNLSSESLSSMMLSIFMWIFIVILILVALTGFINGFIASALCVSYQLRLNKKPIGWVALAILIIAFVTAIVVSYLLIAKVL